MFVALLDFSLLAADNLQSDQKANRNLPKREFFRVTFRSYKIETNSISEKSDGRLRK